MLNNFIYAQTKALFEAQLLAGNILDEAIVFIEDTKEIWNHGTYFGGADVSKLENSIEGLSDAIAALQSGKQDTITDLETIRNNANKGATAIQATSLASVAMSGNYEDLINKPEIPSAVTETTVSDWGFTKNTGTYSKPSSGIPKSDLASAVQTSLGKADTALQSYTEQYKGTVTGVKINGSTKSPSSGTVDIGSVATSVIINGQSNSPSSGVVDLGYVNKELKTSSFYLMSLSPNIYYRNTSTSLSALAITLRSVSNSNIINEYFIEFTTRSSGTTVSFPSDVKWVNGSAPTFDPGCTYQVSIVNNLGTYIKFA